MTFRGTARRMDIGTGIWVLEGRERLTLYGEVPRELDGVKVEVEGDYVENLGVAMLGGRAVKVARVRRDPTSG